MERNIKNKEKIRETDNNKNNFFLIIETEKKIS